MRKKGEEKIAISLDSRGRKVGKPCRCEKKRKRNSDC